MDYCSYGIGVADSGFNSRSGPVRFELKAGDEVQSWMDCIRKSSSESYSFHGWKLSSSGFVSTSSVNARTSGLSEKR